MPIYQILYKHFAYHNTINSHHKRMEVIVSYALFDEGETQEDMVYIMWPATYIY